MENATLTRFFTFHFLFPFIVAAATMVHILFLHQAGANNPLGVLREVDKVFFIYTLLLKILLDF